LIAKYMYLLKSHLAVCGPLVTKDWNGRI
jgi:hypothetical protein